MVKQSCRTSVLPLRHVGAHLAVSLHLVRHSINQALRIILTQASSQATFHDGANVGVIWA